MRSALHDDLERVLSQSSDVTLTYSSSQYVYCLPLLPTLLPYAYSVIATPYPSLRRIITPKHNFRYVQDYLHRGASMHLQVKNIKNAMKVTIDANPGTSIQEFKDMVSVAFGVHSSQQRLIFRGKPMEEGVISDYGVPKEATIHLVLKLERFKEIRIVIRIMTGKVFELDVSPGETVDYVVRTTQELLSEELRDIPRRLHFNGQALKDDQTLSQCNIRNNSTLHLILVPVTVMDQGGPREATAEEDRMRVYGMLGSLYQRCGGIWGVSGPINVPTD